MTDRSVRIPSGWERTGDDEYRYPAAEGGVTVTVVSRESGYQVRASVDDAESLVTHSEFLVSEREDESAAESDAQSFVSSLDGDLDSREGTLTRAVEEAVTGFETRGAWAWLFG